MRVLIAAVVLSGAFGSASATVESIDENAMTVTIEVQVLGSPDSVVAHLSFDDDEPLALPLLDRGEGTYGLRTELAPKNYFVVFEVVGGDGQRSEPVSLMEMGAELGPRSDPTETTPAGDEELGAESERMLWLAIALGAGSLSLLAFWVLGGRDEDEEAVIEDETEVDDRAELSGHEEE